MLDQQLKLNDSLRQTGLHSVQLYGTSLAPITENQCVHFIVDAIESGRGGWCVTVNLEILRQTAINPKLQQLVELGSLRVPDGITLVWASRLQATPLPERVCGSNLIYSLTHEISRRGRSVFFLGGNPGTAERAVEILQQKNPGLRVAGILCPPIGFERDPVQLQRIEHILYTANPDVVYVALGFPKSDYLIAQLRDLCPNAWWIGVGISFSYVAGDLKRPPKWAQNLGIETLYRLVQEPRRLAKRYLWDGPIFVTKLFTFSIIRRFTTL